jgi:porphobilinogen deaminase
MSPDGQREIRNTITGPAADAEALGITLAQKLLMEGAAKLLEAFSLPR